MWLAEMVKLRLGRLFRSDQSCPPSTLNSGESVNDAPSPDDDFHGLEAGQWPGHVPSPGYLGVGLTYVSLALCVAGIVTLHRCTIVEVSWFVRLFNSKLYSQLIFSEGAEAGDPPSVPGDDHCWDHCLHPGEYNFQEGAERTDRPSKGKFLFPSYLSK